MPNRDQYDPADFDSEAGPGPAGSPPRRKLGLAIAGTVAAAAVLGGGSYLVTSRLTAGGTETRELSAPVLRESDEATSAPSAMSAPQSVSPPERSKAAPKIGATPDEKVSKEIAAARSAAARDGVPLRRPLPAATAQGAMANLKVTETSEPLAGGGTLQIVSARGDLSGYQQLAWVADAGEAVGDSRCSQKVRLSNDMEPAERPTLLLCWRTSTEKSVYTVAVNPKGRPSKTASVAAIDRVWAKLR